MAGSLHARAVSFGEFSGNEMPWCDAALVQDVLTAERMLAPLNLK